MKFLEQLAASRRFGMKPGLDSILAVCARLGNPQDRVKAVHVAGTNGKGAVVAMLDACLAAAGMRIGRYTSPHLVRLNERFFLGGRPVDDDTLERIGAEVAAASQDVAEFTFFEALTAVAFRLYAEAGCDYTLLETGLGGRLDATNVCRPVLTVITRVGLDHCQWLGADVAAIAAEKAGIVKAGVPVVLGRNDLAVREVVAERARALDAPFYYAPELVGEADLPADLSLPGAFNRENAQTAVAALKVLGVPASALRGLARTVWPGRFQRVGGFIVDGAHNPPAARALAAALREPSVAAEGKRTLIAGFCGDKDVDAVLKELAPLVSRAYAVRTKNPRSLSAEAACAKLNAAGIPAEPCPDLRTALNRCRSVPALVCGSLFLAGEALVELGAYPWGVARFDPSERLHVRRIGLYGGSFDPVHSGHVGIVRRAIEELALERMFVLPAATNPFKAGRAPGLDAERRLMLVRAAFNGEEKVTVDDRELRRGGVSYAIDTVREFAAEYPDAELFFVVGEDSLGGLPRWKDYDELVKLCAFKAFPRTGESSTEIRRRLAAGEPVADLIPQAVELLLRHEVEYDGDARLVATVLAGLERKGGFCPCRLPKLPEFFCPCEEFRQQLAASDYHGPCHCRLYRKP